MLLIPIVVLSAGGLVILTCCYHCCKDFQRYMRFRNRHKKREKLYTNSNYVTFPRFQAIDDEPQQTYRRQSF